MLNSFMKCTVVAVAVAAALASGGVRAQSYVTAGGQPVRNSEGACWRTAYWTPDSASEECDPQLTKKAAPVAVLAAAGSSEPPKPPAIAAKMVPVTLTTEVLFAFNDATLGGDALKQLDDFGKKLVDMDVKKVVVVGHADGIGSSHYNQMLSVRRLWVVRDHLAKAGIAAQQMSLDAKGSNDPVTSGVCDTLGSENRLDPKLIACLQPDRRVKIEVIGETKAFD